MRNKLTTCGLLMAIAIAPALAQDTTKSPRPTTRSNTASKVKRAIPTSDGTLTLKLRRGLDLQGAPVEMENVELISIIGKVTIPSHTVAGIRFPQKPGEPATVILHNGDSLTGELAMPHIKVISQWGEATVNANELVYANFARNLSWTTDIALNGGNRWRLTSRVSGTNARTPQPTRSQVTRQYSPGF